MVKTKHKKNSRHLAVTTVLEEVVNKRVVACLTDLGVVTQMISSLF
jgi:hypothetical protein